MIARTNGLVVGDLMPEVELRDLDGRLRRLDAFRGRPLLLFLWASW
jgi:peroxiredoxin